jgi:hypothetical protein
VPDGVTATDVTAARGHWGPGERRPLAARGPIFDYVRVAPERAGERQACWVVPAEGDVLGGVIEFVRKAGVDVVASTVAVSAFHDVNGKIS